MNVDHRAPRYLNRIDDIAALSPAEKERLKPVAEQYVFRTNEYYQGLVDWQDPADPLRRIIMPEIRELEEFGELDASHEASYTVAKGLEHKYKDTALILVNNVCGAYCRFCFRKRLFLAESDEVATDLTDALAYIRVHPEISNVLLSGGDPLILSTGRLERILKSLREIDHVRIVRIGTKMPAFNPYRILNDPALLEVLRQHSTGGRKVYVMTHFNHPRELTAVAIDGLLRLQEAGVTTLNQSPMIRGVNDAPEVLAELFTRLSDTGVVPYYIFICRPTSGNAPFVVPVEEALAIFERSRRQLSGLARHARLCMSHKTGKIEVVGKLGGRILFRYHRAVEPRAMGRFMAFASDPSACWLDDYTSGSAGPLDDLELMQGLTDTEVEPLAGPQLTSAE
jgi:lysine 2,3-aminomutase